MVPGKCARLMLVENLAIQLLQQSYLRDSHPLVLISQSYLTPPKIEVEEELVVDIEPDHPWI